MGCRLARPNLTQHFAVKSDTLTLAGAVLLGQDVDISFL
jgi:hypothetical protein